MEPMFLYPLLLIGAAVIGICIIVALAVDSRSVTETSGRGEVPASAAHREAHTESKSDKLRERLVHAGLYKTNSPTLFYLTQLAFVALPVIIGIICYNLGIIRFNTAIIMGLVFGISGVIGPGLWLDYLKSKRQKMIRRSIPDALDVITICVEAGLSLNAALVRVSKDLAATYPMLATELTIVHRHVQMGKTTGEALRSFAERFDLSELRSLSSVVQQSEKFGASISNALRVHGDTLRTKRMQKAQEKAQKAAVWILFPTVICIFPALFVVILGPAAFDIMELLNDISN